MPIRPEKMKLYPGGSTNSPEWRAMVAAVRERAGNVCEGCGVANHALGGRSPDGTFHKAQPLGEKNTRLEWPSPGQFWWCKGYDREHLRIIRIVLTTAHLYEDDESTTDIDRLRYWCQRCHNRYDARMRARGVAKRRREQLAVRDLFSPATHQNECVHG